MTDGAGPGGGTASGDPVALGASLRRRRDGGGKLLIPYLMAGATGDWTSAVEAVVAAGADAVEIGIPFSDPVMDGPVIQQASVIALQRGTTPQGVLDQLAPLSLGVPLVVMTYYNLVFRTGHRRMARRLAAVGVGGAILPDLPLEEIGAWAEEADAAGVDTVMLVAPSSSPPDRVAAICARSRGFVYAVARMGVTGERAQLGPAAAGVVERVRTVCRTPVCLGVGISTPEQAVEGCRVADGVVVGSALVRRLLDGGGPEEAGRFVAEMRAAVDAVG